MSITPDILFPDDDVAKKTARFERYKELLDASAEERSQKAARGQTYDYGSAAWSQSTDPAAALEVLSKSLSPEQTASLQEALASQGGMVADLGKDINLTSPISSGLVPYDLEAPAKMLFPVKTPIRNQTPRVRGQGPTRRIK